MQDKNVPINNKLSLLHARYLQRLKEKQTEINYFLNCLLTEQFNLEDCQALKQLAHNLVGSGATYGFSAISDAAREVEILLQAKSVPDYSQLSAAVRVLLNHCDAASNALPSPSANFPAENSISETVSTINRPLLLIAEDDPTICDIIEEFFQQEAELMIVHDGLQASEILKHYYPNLIILNDIMPGMSGTELLKQIKAEPKLADIPVVLLTAKSQPVEIMQGLQAGAIDYLIKPFVVSELINKIRDCLQKLNVTILIADDDESTRELLGYKFRQAGCRVLLAENGVDALHLCFEHKPQLIILDLMMPGLDGIAVLQKIRQTANFQTTPILFLTAKRQETDILTGLRLGVADYITKPFIPEEVVLRSFRLIKTLKEDKR